MCKRITTILHLRGEKLITREISLPLFLSISLVNAIAGRAQPNQTEESVYELSQETKHIGNDEIKSNPLNFDKIWSVQSFKMKFVVEFVHID